MEFNIDEPGVIKVTKHNLVVATFSKGVAQEELWIKNAIRFCQGMTNVEMEQLVRASRRAEAREKLLGKRTVAHD